MEQEDQKHQRRARYKKMHSKRYEGRYRELQPEEHSETVAKIIQEGSISVGMHIPTMADEILEFLQIQPGQAGLDATLGYGGHISRTLEHLESKGHIYTPDMDSVEAEKTRQRLEHTGYGSEIPTIRKLNSANIDQITREFGPLDFVLADLGVSSAQIGDPSRGFSLKKGSPLDLRLDLLRGEPASERLEGFTQEELIGMLMENSDEPYAEEAAHAVMGKIKRGREVATTIRLCETVDRVLAFIPEEEREEAVRKSCQGTSQALRIDVNSEFEALYEPLDRLPGVLKSGGRTVTLTFHPGKNRIVKRSSKKMHKTGLYSQAVGDVIRLSAEECRMNSRAYSTKVRWAIKAEDSNSQAETVRQQQLVRGGEVS